MAITAITAIEALDIIEQYAKSCRANGETDMRGVISQSQYIKKMISDGKTRDEILAKINEE